LTEYFDRVWEAVPLDAEPERLALRRAFLLERVAPGERVLDVGCGTGELAAALADAGAHPVGVEVAQEALRRAQSRHPGLDLELVGQSGAMPFGDGSFDVAWLGEVLEHVQDGGGLLTEVARVLRPGGRLLASTPDHPLRRRMVLALSSRAFERQFDPRSDHVRFFTRRSLASLLHAAEFAEVDVRPRSGTLLASAVRR
jgi:ubiquinone/menaquinone biosynthesis C-methylase UbiE